MTDTEREGILSRWAEPPSDTEQTRCDNAARVIKKAIAAFDVLNQKDIQVFVQGSYRNNTNVRLNSDVDICVCLMDSWTTDYTFAPNLSDESLGLTHATYTPSEFKTDLEKALVIAFGRSNVRRGDKAFDIKENTYRIEADVVACIEHRRYAKDGSYSSGTSLFPGSGGHTENWPQEHYDNGVGKNKDTGFRFKRLVRIMKHLRNAMTDDRIAVATPIVSFLNECLVWNTPNHLMGSGSLPTDVRKMLIHLWNAMESDDMCSEWGEVNEMKYLFRPSQPWTREQARAWIQAAWNWLEFK